jgi:hypothetical protein
MAGGRFSSLFKLKQDPMLDERFIMHRFKSTRLAVLAGTVLTFVLFTYYAVVRDEIRWDLFSIIASMAVVKICAMVYYRKTN